MRGGKPLLSEKPGYILVESYPIWCAHLLTVHSPHTNTDPVDKVGQYFNV